MDRDEGVEFANKLLKELRGALDAAADHLDVRDAEDVIAVVAVEFILATSGSLDEFVKRMRVHLSNERERLGRDEKIERIIGEGED